MRGSRAIIFSVAALLVVPVASATWFSKGSYEPDTDCDTTTGCKDGLVVGGYNYVSSDTMAAGLKIYFNGFRESTSTGTNPNSEILGSRVNPTGQMQHKALLGVWKDCDMDGYIGTANSALLVYSAQLLPQGSPCSPGTVFHTGTWIYEFIWIGRGGDRAGDDSHEYEGRWINDTEVLMWADFGRPGDTPRGSCPIRPLPAGTTASTGGLINYADCFTSRRVADAVNTVDSDGALGLRFENENAPHKSRSALNQDFPVHPWRDVNGGPNNDKNQTGLYEENSQKVQDDPDAGQDQAFHVWDCREPDANKVQSPTGGDDVAVADPSGGVLDGINATGDVGDDDGTDGQLSVQIARGGTVVSFPNPAPGVDNPRGSYYDAVNGTERGAANVWFGGNIGGNGAENCNTDNSTVNEGLYLGSLEGAVTAAGSTGKKTANDVFAFDLGGSSPRGRQFSNARVANPVDDPTNKTLFSMNIEDELDNRTGGDTGDHLNDTLGDGYPNWAGTAFRGALILHPGWNAITNWANTDVTINRATLEPQGGQYVTYYAKIGSATTATGATTAKNNVASVYGNEWCNGAVSGDVGGFDCDKTHWYNVAFGASAMPTRGGRDIGPRAGESFHLRDIDCYDTKLVRGVEVYASLAQISPTGPCADAAI